MSTADRIAAPSLFDGQRLGRAEFHELYETTPERFRAELIGGVVRMPCPTSERHDIVLSDAAGWLWTYASRTPGVRHGIEASLLLDDRSEVHAGGFLRIRPEHGGQTRPFGIYIGGCPELIIEVALSSRDRDLGEKFDAYERAGAQEYVVFALDPDEVFWHVRRGDRLERVGPDGDGLYRSTAFSGLWLESDAIFAEDGPRLVATLERGLATENHAAFVARLGLLP